MNEHVRHPQPGKLEALLAAWADRDSRYVMGRQHRLTDEEEEQVQIERRREADRLPPDERVQALRALSKWTPPGGRAETPPPEPRPGPWGLRRLG